MLIKDEITPGLQKIREKLSRLPREAFDVWLKATPKRTGNARRRTRLKDDEIQANYAYAARLDSGASSQAPDGMSKPTYDYVKKRSKQIMRK